MKQQITFMVVFTIIGLLSTIALADAKEFAADIPFDYQNSGCTLVLDTPDYKKYDCTATWKSENFKYEDELTTPDEDGCASGMDIDVRTGECRPYGEIQEEAKQLCFDDPECPLGVYNPTVVDPLMPDEDSDRTGDKELIKKINATIFLSTSIIHPFRRDERI